MRIPGHNLTSVRVGRVTPCAPGLAGIADGARGATTIHGMGSLRTPHSALRTELAFSLIEIMVTVTLLAFIILGLVAMFNQTRRAFTSSITQVDILESGRSSSDIVTREMEQVAAANAYNVFNFYVDSPVANGNYAYLIQPLVDPTENRTNNLQEVCFVTRYNQQWNFIGYKILQSNPNDNNLSPSEGIGTLYRYSASGIALTNLPALINNFNTFITSTRPTQSANFSRLVDGVVDFRIRALDTNGNSFFQNNHLLPVPVTPTVTASLNFKTDDQFSVAFTSNALPAFVDVELGVLEDRPLAHYEALVIPPYNLGPGTAPWGYLTNRAGAVHIFRQRITIRNVNPAAF
jgi:hypothetical protein